MVGSNKYSTFVRLSEEPQNHVFFEKRGFCSYLRRKPVFFIFKKKRKPQPNDSNWNTKSNLLVLKKKHFLFDTIHQTQKNL